MNTSTQPLSEIRLKRKALNCLQKQKQRVEIFFTPLRKRFLDSCTRRNPRKPNRYGSMEEWKYGSKKAFPYFHTSILSYFQKVLADPDPLRFSVGIDDSQIQMFFCLLVVN